MLRLSGLRVSRPRARPLGPGITEEGPAWSLTHRGADPGLRPGVLAHRRERGGSGESIGRGLRPVLDGPCQSWEDLSR